MKALNKEFAQYMISKATERYVKSFKKSPPVGWTGAVKSGNSKLACGVNVLPAIYTCAGCSSFCAKACYANKAELQYPGAQRVRWASLLAFIESPVAWTAEFIRIVKKQRTKYFRFNESGDVVNQVMLDAYFSIARAFPNKNFLMFTKTWRVEGFDYSACPSNLRIQFSVDKSMTDRPTTDAVAYTVATGDEPLSSVHICKGGGKSNGIWCGRECTHCWHKNGVQFLQH